MECKSYNTDVKKIALARTNTSAISKVKWRLLFNSFDADVNKSRRQRHGVEIIPPQKS